MYDFGIGLNSAPLFTLFLKKYNEGDNTTLFTGLLNKLIYVVQFMVCFIVQ